MNAVHCGMMIVCGDTIVLGLGGFGWFCHHTEVVGRLCDLMGYVTIPLLRQSIVIRCGSIYSLRVRNLADAMTIFEYPDEATCPTGCNLPHRGAKEKPTAGAAGRD